MNSARRNEVQELLKHTFLFRMQHDPFFRMKYEAQKDNQKKIEEKEETDIKEPPYKVLARLEAESAAQYMMIKFRHEVWHITITGTRGGDSI